MDNLATLSDLVGKFYSMCQSSLLQFVLRIKKQTKIRHQHEDLFQLLLDIFVDINLTPLCGREHWAHVPFLSRAKHNQYLLGMAVKKVFLLR